MASTTPHSGQTLGCVRAATRILGDQWTPRLLVALAESPRRFCELERAAEGITPRVLSIRLKALETHKILQKYETSRPFYYRLTKKGADLIPLLQAMADWSRTYHSSH